MNAEEIRAAAQASLDGKMAETAITVASPQPDPLIPGNAPSGELPENMKPQSEEAKAAAFGTDPVVVQLQAQLAQAMQVMQAQAAQLAVYAPQASRQAVWKRYRSNIPFITVPIMRAPGHCDNVQFQAGILDTKDLAVQDVLDKCIAVGGLGFSFDGEVAPVDGVEEMTKDIASVATRAHARMVAAGQSTA